MIAVIDYGVGNLFSLSSSLAYLGLENKITRSARELDEASHIIPVSYTHLDVYKRQPLPSLSWQMRFQQAPYRLADVVALLFIAHGLSLIHI